MHSGRTGRYGEAFAPVETTLTWGKGLKLEDLAEQEHADSAARSQTEANTDATGSSPDTSMESSKAAENEQSAEPTVPAPPARRCLRSARASGSSGSAAATAGGEAKSVEQSDEQHETSESKEND